MPPHVLKKKKNGGHKINKIFNSAYFYLQEQHNIRSWNGQKCTRNGKLRVLKNACPKRAQFVAKCGAQEKNPIFYPGAVHDVKGLQLRVSILDSSACKIDTTRWIQFKFNQSVSLTATSLDTSQTRYFN